MSPRPAMHTRLQFQAFIQSSNKLTVKTILLMILMPYIQPDNLPFGEWCIERAKASVHFDYWLKTLSLELLLLRYIRSLHEGNFQRYVEFLM